MISLKNWEPMTLPEIDKLPNPKSTIEFEKALYYHNGYCWGKGICTSLTIKGNTSVYWKLGFWRAGGRKSNLRKTNEKTRFNSFNKGSRVLSHKNLFAKE